MKDERTEIVFIFQETYNIPWKGVGYVSVWNEVGCIFRYRMPIRNFSSKKRCNRRCYRKIGQNPSAFYKPASEPAYDEFRISVEVAKFEFRRFCDNAFDFCRLKLVASEAKC